jgi:hypothetical protein
MLLRVYLVEFLATPNTSFTQLSLPISSTMRSRQCATHQLHTMCIIEPMSLQLHALSITTWTTLTGPTKQRRINMKILITNYNEFIFYIKMKRCVEADLPRSHEEH